MKEATKKVVLSMIAGLLCISYTHGMVRDKAARKQLYDRYKSEEKGGIGLVYENDYSWKMIGLKDLNEDRNYTMGVGFTLSGNWMDKGKLTAPNDLLFDKIYKQPQVAASYCRLSLLNTAFTPRHIEDPNAIHNDRPYASLLVAIVGKTYVYERNRAVTIELGVGIIGLPISKVIQTAIHQSMQGKPDSRPIPQGWSHQVSDGGEPTLLFTIEKQYKQDMGPGKCKKIPLENLLEVKTYWKASAGYYTGAMAGASFRLGYIKPETWFVRNSVTEDGNKALPYPTRSEKDKSENSNKILPKPKCIDGEIYLTGAVEPNLILYNGLLMGQFRNTDVRTTYANCVPVVLNMNAGLKGTIICHGHFFLTLGALIYVRSPEILFPDQPARWHSWPSIQFSVNWR
jgi:hypothetical protein